MSPNKADDTQGNVLSNVAGQLWLMLPSMGNQVRSRVHNQSKDDINLLPILSGKVPNQHCSKKVPGKIAQKDAPCIMSCIFWTYGFIVWQSVVF